MSKQETDITSFHFMRTTVAEVLGMDGWDGGLAHIY